MNISTIFMLSGLWVAHKIIFKTASKWWLIPIAMDGVLAWLVFTNIILLPPTLDGTDVFMVLATWSVLFITGFVAGVVFVAPIVWAWRMAAKWLVSKGAWSRKAYTEHMRNIS